MRRDTRQALRSRVVFVNAPLERSESDSSARIGVSILREISIGTVQIFQYRNIDIFDNTTWQYSQACGHPCCLCTFSYPISSFHSTLHLICFDTALLEQPPLSAMTLCDLPSLWRVPMIIFWTIAKSAVFLIIVVLKNKRPQFMLYGWSFIKTQIFWDTDFFTLISCKL